MTARQLAHDWIDWLFGADDETPEFAYPVLAEGDKLYRDTVEYTIDTIVETCPFVAAPAEWAAWGTSGAWCYVTAVDLALEASPLAVSHSDSAWLPYDYLVMITLEQ